MLATLTEHLTAWIADHGVLAVFVLMAVDALLPVGGELIMVYAGVLAAGAVSGHHTVVFGVSLADGLESYLVLSLGGALGYVIGALLGWSIGMFGGRAFVERHGRWIHLSPERLRRAERWFERFGSRAVLWGRVTPVVRSFISIPAGVFGHPFGSYTVLTTVGSLIWCLGFAAVGWTLGASWEHFDKGFRFAEVVAAALVLAVLVIVTLRRRRRPPHA